MPYGKEEFSRSLDPNLTMNQAMPLLLSNKGRYIWSEDPIDFVFKDNRLEVCSKGEIILKEGFESLRGAFLNASKNYFPPKKKMPHPLLFTAPQYNTWIELMYDQREEKILQYAEDIINQGMPPGVFMIDDNWQEDYGVWKFHEGRFSNPKAMVDKLHGMGFKVMLWTCPFISADSQVFRYLREKDCLIKNKDGDIAIREWWNGYSAVLDFTNEDAAAWYDKQLQKLVNEYGIDGFKFDAGDPRYYKEDDRTKVSKHPNEHCRAFARYGCQYELNEYRSSWKMAGEPLAQRLCDKHHKWDTDGLASLTPNGLAQGLMGYGFMCPDMIGGGEYLNFLPGKLNLDEELVVRYAQCSALFPMMQFSVAPWRILSKENLQYCVDVAHLHAKFGTYILELAKNTAITGEPIMRHLSYCFGEGFEEVNDQFMLGDELLVAPVIVKGQRERMVTFPEGIWEGDDGSAVNGPCTKKIAVPLSRLPYYKKKR
jgi:alpha-glucosidase (family GH31 glycosyl hydrolase)